MKWDLILGHIPYRRVETRGPAAPTQALMLTLSGAISLGSVVLCSGCTSILWALDLFCSCCIRALSLFFFISFFHYVLGIKHRASPYKQFSTALNPYRAYLPFFILNHSTQIYIWIICLDYTLGNKKQLRKLGIASTLFREDALSVGWGY